MLNRPLRPFCAPFAPRRLLVWSAQAAMMFLASRAVLMNRLSPFAPALFSAGLACSFPPAAMLAGCLLAAPVGVAGPESFSPLLGCLGTWAAALLWRIVTGRALSNRAGRDARMAALALVGALLPGLILSQGLFYNLLAACTTAVVAAATAPSMWSALRIRRGRTRLLPEERLSAALLLAIAGLGLASLPGMFARSAVILACLCALLVSGSGMASGALAGAAAGLALRLGGFDPLFAALFPLPAILAGAASRFSRPAGAAAFLPGMALIAAWSFGAEAILPDCVCAVLAGTAYCLLPEDLARLAAGPRAAASQEEENLALRRQRAGLARQTRALASVFAELSRGYSAPQAALPDEAVMTARLRDKLCAGCPSRAACWGEGDGSAGRMLAQLLSLAFSGAVPTEGEELPPQFARLCRRAGQIPRRLGPILSDYESRRRAETKRARLTALMAAQFGQAGEILGQAADRVESGPESDPSLARAARAALEKEGVQAELVAAVGGDSPEIWARLARAPEDAAALRRAAGHISAEADLPFQARQEGDLDVRFSLKPRRALKAGSRSVAARAGRPSGDSRAAVRLADGRVLLALSDGMGSGARAGLESGETLRLLSRFLQAGVEPGAAIDAVNELMLLRSGEDIFATVDLCLVDAAGASAELIKLGACRTYLLRGGACVRIEGGRLPLGILEQVRPVRRSLPLCPGDLLVMATDGLDGGEGDDWIVETICRAGSEPPQRVCDLLVEGSLSRALSHRDDTTVLAVRVA